MNVRQIGYLIKKSVLAWIDDYAPSMGAAIAYYTLFSIAPLLIIIRLQEYDYAGATAVATIMLAISFVLLLAINLLQTWTRRRLGHV